MADQQLSPYERVRQYFEPDLNRKEIADAFYADTTDRQNAKEAWAKANDTERQHLVAQAAPKLLEQGETLDSFLTSVQRDMPSFAPEPSFDQAGQQSPPGSPNTLSAAIKKLTETKESSTTGSRDPDAATPLIHSIQEEELLKSFEHILQMPDSPERADALRSLLDHDMEAPQLLGNQINIIKEYILDTKHMSKGEADAAKEAAAKKLLEEAEERQKKRTEKDTTEEGAKEKAARDTKDEALRKQLDEALLKSKENPDGARDAFRALAQHRVQETTRQYYVLEGMADDEGDTDEIFGRMVQGRAAAAQRRTQQSQQRQEEEHAEEGLTEARQQAQQRQPRSNPLTSFLGNLKGKAVGKLAKAGFKDFLKNQLKKQAVQTLIKVLFVTPPYIGWWIVGILLAVVAVVVVIVLIVALILSLTGQGQDNTTPIPGFTLKVDTNPPGKTSYQNGQNINFTIDATYTGTYSIVVVDQTPDNANIVPNSPSGKYNDSSNAVAWNLDANPPLPDSTDAVKHWKFTLTFSPKGTDFVFHNIVTAQYAQGSGPNAFPTSTSGPLPQAGGSCSPDSLQKYFGSAQAAAIASCICKYESGGDPGIVNKSCTRGGTADWSVGLFQINLDTNPQRCPGAFSQVGTVCKIANTNKLNACTANFMDPVTNINAAVSIYHASHNTWDNGWHAEKGKCF